MATAGERTAPAVEVINASVGGVLVAYDEPVGVVADERVVISLTPPDRAGINLLGRVARVAHGTDFRTYVAVRFEETQIDEIDELERAIDAAAVLG